MIEKTEEPWGLEETVSKNKKTVSDGVHWEPCLKMLPILLGCLAEECRSKMAVWQFAKCLNNWLND